MSNSSEDSVTVTSSRFKPDMALADLTAQYLKDNYLTGLKLLIANDQELSDEWYETKLGEAIAKVEELTNVDILQRRIRGEKHDYHAHDYVQYGFLQLFRLPCLSVQEVRAEYPTGNSIQVFPSEWVRLEKAHAQVNLVPTAGSLSQVLIGQGAGYLPLIYAQVSKLPSLWSIDYMSGFDEEHIPLMLIETVCKVAVVEIFTIMSDTIYPIGVGSQSLSIDGMSQSRSFQMPAFKARVDQYRQDIGYAGSPTQRTGLLSQIRNNYLGVNLASL